MSGPIRALQLLVVILLLTGVYACAPTTPVEPADTPEETESRADSARAGDQAQEAAVLYDAAAAAYEEAADRSRVSVAAARQWLEADEEDAAITALARVQRQALDDEDRAEYDLLRAELLIVRGQHERAQRALAEFDPPSDREADYWRLRAEAAAGVGAFLRAAEHRVALDELLERAPEREANRTALWDYLGRVPATELREAEPEDNEFGGWVRLAQLARTHRLDPQRLEDAVEAWQADHPDHPAVERQAPELITRYRERIHRPTQIALLVPLSGDFAAAGRAIRDGALVAHYASEVSDRPTVQVYDTAGDAERAARAYRRAIADGAEMVIGPVTRDAVKSVIDAHDDNPEPLLTLNRVADAGRDSLYQFALSPEDEARQAAHQARELGWETAIALAPDSDWGSRVLTAFEEAFTESGGILLQSDAYDPSEADFSSAIRETLNLRVSGRRHQELVRTLGQSLEYQPRRRQDVDGIFMAAFPEVGRLLRPQLEYHHAQDLPVLATSHVFTGTAQPEEDRDLGGLRFLDGPWLIDAALGVPDGLERERLEHQLGGVMERHARLVALGIDAYRILPYLELLEEHPEEQLDGLTGSLRLDEQRRVQRGLVMARFEGGRPVFDRPAAGRNETDHGIGPRR